MMDKEHTLQTANHGLQNKKDLEASINSKQHFYYFNFIFFTIFLCQNVS